MNIRKAQKGDAEQIGALAESGGLFPASMLGDFFDPDGDALWLVAENGTLAGFTYVIPEPMAENVWNMLALGVAPVAQRSGVGRALVSEVTGMLEKRGVRLLIVETSSGPEQEGAQAFYPAQGFHAEGKVRNFYAVGEDKLTFTRTLSALS